MEKKRRQKQWIKDTHDIALVCLTWQLLGVPVAGPREIATYASSIVSIPVQLSVGPPHEQNGRLGGRRKGGNVACTIYSSLHADHLRVVCRGDLQHAV